MTGGKALKAAMQNRTVLIVKTDLTGQPWESPIVRFALYIFNKDSSSFSSILAAKLCAHKAIEMP